jgi:hypothetical protein
MLGLGANNMTLVYWAERPPKHYMMYSLELPSDGREFYQERNEEPGLYLCLLKDGSYKDFNSDWTKP